VGTPTDGLRVLAADEDHEALARTSAILEALGHTVTATAVDLAEVTEAITREDPELSVVVAHSDEGHALDLIEEIAAFAGGPVVLLIPDDDPEIVRLAAERGVHAITRTDEPGLMRSAIEVAWRRHEDQAELAEHVGRLESAIERRAVIERAKGILMERHGLDERQAFDRLRTFARSNNRTVLSVADAVADGHALLGNRGD
jgi:response regulator NasT